MTFSMMAECCYAECRYAECQGAPLWSVPALPLKIRLGWKWLEATNTLAYCDTALITTVRNVLRV
jgi:hypothetical protein